MKNKQQFSSFKDVVSFSVNEVNNDITKKYKGEKLKKAKQALQYTDEFFATLPVGFNLGDSQDTIKDDCEKYVKAKFQGAVQLGPDGQPVGFVILTVILFAIISWVVSKILDKIWDNWQIS